MDTAVLERVVAVPWWIAYIIGKTVDYTRYCGNLEEEASIRGASKAIDHTYASVEMRRGKVANLRDACDGLKLALRGRIRIRADLIDFGEKPMESFKKTDAVIEDMMRHATRSVGDDIYVNLDGIKELEQEIDHVLKEYSTFSRHAALKKAIDWMHSTAPEKVRGDLLNEMEVVMNYHPDKLDEKSVREYYYSAFEMLVNAGVYAGRIDESNAIKHVFIPEVF
jgi:molybdenum-dependent DNA-binding transcriptional regulator ModE